MRLVERQFDTKLAYIFCHDGGTGAETKVKNGLRLGTTNLGQLSRHIRVFVGV